MKIQKIKSIESYKSFSNYKWHDFCNAETFHTQTNIFFGENGSGKSSICNILKSVSQNRDFAKYLPQNVELQIQDTSYTYSSNNWGNRLQKNSVLFFDREFVDSNIHLGRNRGTQHDEHEQKSAKIIIEFDAEAIRLRGERDRLQQVRNIRNSKVEEYKTENKASLNFLLSSEDEPLYKRYKNRGKQRLIDVGKKIEERRNDITNKIKNDKKLLVVANEIQEIEELVLRFAQLTISKQQTYQALFRFRIKEKARVKAEEKILEKITSHKDFFQKGIDILGSHPTHCPFCQSTKTGQDIKKIIDSYNYLFDNSYKEQLRIFETNKKNLIDELLNIKTSIESINLNTIFIPLKNLSDKYSIKNIYVLNEEKTFREKVELTKINELLKNLQTLEKPNNEDVSKLYKESKKEVEIAKKHLSELKKLIQRKNKLITSFKNEHTTQKLATRIYNQEQLIINVENEINFLRSNKIDNVRIKNQKVKALQKHQDYFEKAKEEYNKTRQKYEEYCSTEAFTKTLTKIESYFNHFNFSFKLILDTQNRHTSSTKEMPFAFKVVDLEGRDRDLMEGLSEGEMQVLSLCFFFAFLEIQASTDQKILVFDDPITSLDDSNLSNLVDLLAIERDKFSQLFIFSHHRTFFKFLRKRFNDTCSEYNIIRNKKHLGGSFICKSRQERFIPKLTNFEAHLLQLGQNPQGFDVEAIIVEYGQYLRYETEQFIKCNLLHWDESDRFADVIEGIKQTKLVDNADLDKIKQIYSFCNWTTSHVDVGDDHGLARLKDKITDFVTIHGKY